MCALLTVAGLRKNAPAEGWQTENGDPCSVCTTSSPSQGCMRAIESQQLEGAQTEQALARASACLYPRSTPPGTLPAPNSVLKINVPLPRPLLASVTIAVHGAHSSQAVGRPLPPCASLPNSPISQSNNPNNPNNRTIRTIRTIEHSTQSNTPPNRTIRTIEQSNNPNNRTILWYNSP